jgi:hypothetical protein
VSPREAGPHTAEDVPVGQPVWRVWTFRPDGTFPRSGRDRHGSPLLWASCDYLPHGAPAPDCGCGLFGVVDLRDLLDAIENRPISVELQPLRALQRGRGLLDALRSSHLPDLVGRCRTYGAVEPGTASSDPPGTVRAEALTVEALYLSPRRSSAAEALTEDVGVAPVVAHLDQVCALTLG